MSNGYSPDDLSRIRAALGAAHQQRLQNPDQSADQIDANNDLLLRALSGQGTVPPPAPAAPPSQAPASVPASPAGSQFLSGVNSALSGPTTVTAPPQAAPTLFNPYAGGGGGEQGPSTPPARAVPETWIDTRSPEGRAAIAESGNELRAGQARQLAGVQSQADVESKAADEIAGATAQNNEAARALAWRQAQQSQYERNALEQHMQSLQQRADDYAKQKIDPSRIWKDEHTPFIAFGAALSSLGDALMKQPDHGHDLLNRMIDRDIAAQEHDIATSKEGLDTAKGLLADKWRLFGDREQARLAARQELAQSAAAQIDAISKKYASPAIKARAEQASGQMQQTFADAGLKLKMLQEESKKYMPAHVVGGPGYGVSDVKPDEVVTLPDGRQVTVPTADREQVVGALRQHQMVGAAAAHARQLLSVPLTSRGPGWVKDYDATQEVLAKAELVGGGKGGKGLIEMNAAAGGGRTLTFTPGVEQALRTLEQGSAQNAQAAADNTAQYEVEPQLMVDPRTGRQERKYRIKGQYKRGGQDQAPPPGFKPVGGGGVAGNTAGASSAAGAGAAMADEISPVDRDARFGELGVLNRPDGDISTEISITVTDPRLNGGRPTNIPTLVKGQVGVDQLLAGKRPTELQQEMAVRRAVERQRAGANLPSFKTIPEAVSAAELRTHSKGGDVPYTQGGS